MTRRRLHDLVLECDLDDQGCMARYFRSITIAGEGDESPERWRIVAGLAEHRGTTSWSFRDMTVSVGDGGRFEARAGRVVAQVDSLGRTVRVLDQHHETATGTERALSIVVLALILQTHGRFVVHGALVRDDSGGVALVGGSGVGKSSTALWLSKVGFSLCGDDTFYLRIEDGIPIARAVPQPVHIDPRSLHALPELRGRLGERYGEKKRVFSTPLDDARLPLGRVVWPELGAGSSTRLRPATGAWAWIKLIEASIFAGEPAFPRMREQLDALAMVARRAAHYRLILGEDALQDPIGALLPLTRALSSPASAFGG